MLHMTPKERERMNSVCILIQNEKDHKRFEAWLRELNEIIGRKERRFPQNDGVTGTTLPTRPWKTLSAVVQKILKDVDATRTDTVEIAISEAHDLYREIRIENRFTDVEGRSVALKQGAHVDVTFEADPKDTTKQGNGHAA